MTRDEPARPAALVAAGFSRRQAADVGRLIREARHTKGAGFWPAVNAALAAANTILGAPRLRVDAGGHFWLMAPPEAPVPPPSLATPQEGAPTLTLTQYAARTGGTTSDDVYMHIQAGLRSLPANRRAWYERTTAELQRKRDATTAAYETAIAAGEVIRPAPATLEERAAGEGEAAEAARRVLAKRVARKPVRNERVTCGTCGAEWWYSPGQPGDRMDHVKVNGRQCKASSTYKAPADRKAKMAAVVADGGPFCLGATVPQPDPNYHPCLPWSPVRDEVCGRPNFFAVKCTAHVCDRMVRSRPPAAGSCWGAS